MEVKNACTAEKPPLQDFQVLNTFIFLLNQNIRINPKIILKTSRAENFPPDPAKSRNSVTKRQAQRGVVPGVMVFEILIDND